MVKLYRLFAVVAALAATTAVRAETAPAPPDPLATLQTAFGDIVGASFRVPDQVVAATAPGTSDALSRPLGGVLRTSLQIPGAAFAALMAPLGDSVTPDTATKPAAAAAPKAARRRVVKAHHRHRQTA